MSSRVSPRKSLMRFGARWSVLMAGPALALALPQPAYAQLGGGAEVTVPKADTILINGNIRTPQGWVTALAMVDGVILTLGSDADIRSAAANDARVIDLAGKTVLPGLHDLHVHATSGGMVQSQCQVNPDAAMREALATIANCVAGKKPGEWVTGRAYEPAALGVTPTKELLDSISPNNPVMLTDVSIHSAWVNSAALRLAGIDKNTPDPAGGIIERNSAGEPTGVLRESASQLVGSKVPPATSQETAAALSYALDYILTFGITAIDDALVSGDVAQAYAELADQGKLKTYVRGCMIGRDAGLIDRRQLYARPNFSPSCVKLIADGVPTDSHTAAMLEDYADDAHGEGRNRGMLFVPPEELAAQLIRYDQMGLTVKLHAAGDAAVHEGLDAIAAARTANGFSGLLHDISHNSFVTPEDFARAKQLNAVLEFSPYIWFDSPIVQNITKAIGPERMQRWIPIKDALDAGVFTIVGSDWNVVPSVNPWLAMETLVTRRPPGDTTAAPIGAGQAITLDQAFDLFTIEAARHMYRADKVGSLEPGKQATLIVIDRNIFSVPINTVHQTKVLATVIAGETVYGHLDQTSSPTVK